MINEYNGLNSAINPLFWRRRVEEVDKLKELEFQRSMIELHQIEAMNLSDIQQMIKEKEIMEKTTFKEKDLALDIMADWFGLTREEAHKALRKASNDKENPARVEERAWETIARNNQVPVEKLKKALDKALNVYIVRVPGMADRYYQRGKHTGVLLGETTFSRLMAGRFSLSELENEFSELKPFAELQNIDNEEGT